MNHKVLFIARQILAGKTIYRALFNLRVSCYCRDIQGKVLDLASGATSSYQDLLPQNGVIYVRGDIKQGTPLIDFNASLPFTDNSFDAVLLFNALYIAKDPQKTLSEVKRVLKPHGKLFLSMPFIANEMAEPHDFCRYTAEGIEMLVGKVGLQVCVVDRFGERFSAAMYLLHNFFLFNIIRLGVYGVALWADRYFTALIRKKYPCPLGYFCVISKN